LAEAAAPSDSLLFLGATYKYTYLLTYQREMNPDSLGASRLPYPFSPSCFLGES